MSVDRGGPEEVAEILVVRFTRNPIWVAQRCPQAGWVRVFCLILLGALTSAGYADLAQSEELDANSATAAFALPNIYLDMSTYYTAVPANVLSFRFDGSFPPLAKLPPLSSSSSRSVSVNAPLAVDLTDWLTVEGGVTGSAAQIGTSDWSAFTVTAWMMQVQADVYQQNGGLIPTITIQSTVTKSVPESPLTTTSFNNILEFDYALNKDETKGLLAGIQYVRVAIVSPLATIDPYIIGYVGGYYQWNNNWKLTGRVGIQSFGGAQIPNQNLFPSFTQPVIRIDLDRNDDNDNRLFGVTAQIDWTPKPAYQLTVRTPLYAIRN